MRLIPLTQGKFAKVSDQDFGRISKFKWHARRTPRTFYAARQVRLNNGRQRARPMHRDILKANDNVEIDHRDHDGLNNQRRNLRRCAPSENTYHYQKPVTNTSGFVGVWWNAAAKKWQAAVSYRGKNRHVGLFKNQRQAAEARDKMAKSFRKKFAFLNFK